MVKITTLTDTAIQSCDVLLADGTSFTLTLYYKPTVQRWVFDCSYKTWAITGLGLCVHPNILRTWKEIIPFGLAVASSDKADPFNLEDFVSGRVSIYVLDSTLEGTEVTDVEHQVYGEVTV